jgi:two-component system, OmpR family, sensor kinase
MTRSLERRLSRTLGLAMVLVGLVAGAVSFIFAYQEAQEFQDDTLRQIATLAYADKLLAEGHADVIGTPANVDGDQEDRVMVVRLLPGAVPAQFAWLPLSLRPGLHTVTGPQGDWRVFVRQTKPGERIAVAQMTEVRDEAASDSAEYALVPLGVLLPLLVFLIHRIVHHEFAPVRLLAQKLDEQPPNRPTSLPDAGLPDEIAPFVRSINGLLQRITKLMGEQRRFIADAAHELRSPLTALSLQAQNLEKVDTLEAMRERVVPLRAGIERARRLTEQLLNLARSQAAPPALETVDVSRMARELIAEYIPLAEARGIDLGLEETGSISLVTEPQALRLVIKNALDNALSYTPRPGEVTVRIYAEGDDAVIEVRDTGPGIPIAERERVFDPFYRIEGSCGQGSGLGLAIARDAATRLRGKLSLDDRPDGRGLVFRYRQRRNHS